MYVSDVEYCFEETLGSVDVISGAAVLDAEATASLGSSTQQKKPSEFRQQHLPISFDTSDEAKGFRGAIRVRNGPGALEFKRTDFQLPRTALKTSSLYSRGVAHET